MNEQGTQPRVYLVETMTELEDDVLRTWLERQANDTGQPPPTVEITDEALADLALRKDDPLLTPLRVVWLPGQSHPEGVQQLRETLSLRDPLHPSQTTQRKVMRDDPSRCHVLEGDPAPLSDLERRLAETGGGSLPDFIRRQAALTLERAERTLLGTQYKVSRFVVDEITDSSRYQSGTHELSTQLNLPIAEVNRRARGALDEMVAAQSRRAIAVWDQLGRYFSRAYRLDVDTTRLDELRELNKNHSLVFLPSHRSYLDPLVLRPALLANKLPLNHVMGGLNINFWPIGPIGKRSGTVFIRRKFGDDEVYKWTLREYMRYLLTKRFNLEWYIEGGRSRTGKLRPPRFGLLNYLAQAFQTSGMSDVYLVPVSLTYDQLYEVGAMAAEAHGEAKSKESLRWLLGYVRAQGRRHGVAHVNIGRPLSLADYLGQEDDPRLAVQKTAFEVCHRINEVTPVTASSLVMLAFLGIEDRALTVAEVSGILGPLVDYIKARSLPTAGDVDLTDPHVIRTAVRTHLESGVLRSFDRSSERVFYLGPDQHLVAAFYRNNTIHFLVMRAIAEMVVLAACDKRFTDPPTDGLDVALRLRDTLKFEFFFSEKDSFRDELRIELDLIDPRWEANLGDPEHAERLLSGMDIHLAHRVLQPFLEAYAVVASQLLRTPVHRKFDEKTFMASCLALAEQRRLRQQIGSSESISAELFSTALKLARNRGVVEPNAENLEARRAEFAEEISTLVDQVLRIRTLAHAHLDRIGGR
ncbi:glycerol-3-phosphate acyltransferase [Rhodococcus sp. WMMA185]|uniref:glycerol-3-phosphate 1-O-acyltransferase n=1 Tax=Rhodococcus sp. WMMA185 TaxID=679318 RepID=UPI00087880D8|nr:glycerol-3-phosphate 1-O-acyltransferase [Rhodococcus sp. WMMA185]AOW91839.1 glycerol-3-phosphate acyltransferase [Rhodococcus sp. WMMA185]